MGNLIKILILLIREGNCFNLNRSRFECGICVQKKADLHIFACIINS